MRRKSIPLKQTEVTSGVQEAWACMAEAKEAWSITHTSQAQASCAMMGAVNEQRANKKDTTVVVLELLWVSFMLFDVGEQKNEDWLVQAVEMTKGRPKPS